MIRSLLLSIPLAFGLFAVGQSLPEYEVTVLDETSTGYYTLIPIRIGAGNPTAQPFHMILDGRGEPVYYKPFPQGMNTGDLKLQPNGLLSYSFMNKFYLLDSTFTVVDSVRCKNGIMQDGHDMQVLPNGHFLLLGWENEVMDLSAYPLFNGNGTPGSSTAVVRCGVIQEQDADKNVVFEWHARDHYAFADVDPVHLTNPVNVDWTHFNAVEEDTDGNILVSTRHFNEVTKIDRTTGDIIWRLGGNAGQFTFTNDASGFQAQHDIRRLPNGNITLLDNGSLGTPLHPVAAKEYELDETDHLATLAWSHVLDPSLFSSAIGNVQRLPNGNTLIDPGMVDGLNAVFTVVDPYGEAVFTIEFTDTLRSYRAFNYGTWPWELHRPTITCVESNGQFFLDAGSGHASYQWSTGETTQMIPVANTGDHWVFVPRGDGGFIRSESFIVGSLVDPCGPNAIPELDDASRLIYSLSSLESVLSTFDANGHYELANAQGTTTRSGTRTEGWDLSNLGPGLYYLRMTSPDRTATIRFVQP